MAASKVLFITGANTGLGLEIVKSLCRSKNSYNIILGCRSTSKGDAAIAGVKKEYPSTSSSLSVVQTDLASDESIEKAINTIGAQHGRIDVLINNAGGGFDHLAKTGELSLRQAFNTSWDVNVSGTHVLTTFAVPLLLKSSDPRLIFMTSGTSTLTESEDLTSPIGQRINGPLPAGWPKNVHMPLTAYRSVKTGLNMVMREWVKTLTNDGVKIWAISPGMLATNLHDIGAEKLKAMGAQDPSVGADFTVSVVEGARDHHVGKAIRKDNVQPW